jgi:hypothetical protein
MVFSIKSCVWQGIIAICISLAITGVIYQSALRNVAQTSAASGGYSYYQQQLANASALYNIRGRVAGILSASAAEDTDTGAINGVSSVVSGQSASLPQGAVALTSADISNLRSSIKSFLEWASQQPASGAKSVLNWSRLANNEIHLMNVLGKFLKLVDERQSSAIFSGDVYKLATNGYQCSRLEAAQQKEISKTIHMDICSEIEWYKVIQLCYPDASNFIDVGANKGYLGSLFVALWGMNTFGVSPAKVFEISTTLKSWETSRNPAGYCRDGYNHGIPLYCPDGRSTDTGECVNVPDKEMSVYSIDGSSYLTATLNDIIQTQFAHAKVSSGKVWKYFNFAMSDRVGSIFFTKQSKTSNPGFEGKVGILGC